jgi:hypothetical protein
LKHAREPPTKAPSSRDELAKPGVFQLRRPTQGLPAETAQLPKEMTIKMKASPRQRWAWVPPLTALLAASCLALLAIGTAALAAPSRHNRHRASFEATLTIPRPLLIAAKLSTRADRKLVAEARALKLCLRANPPQSGRCVAAGGAVQGAGVSLRGAERRLARIARASAKAHNAAAATGRPPKLTVTGYRLSWTRIAHVRSYVLMRIVPGQARQYSLLSATYTTPPPVPGLSVSYEVRTAVYWSAWSNRETVAYPSPTVSPTPAPTPRPSRRHHHERVIVEALDTQAAPAISVSRETLTWNAVANVNTYVLVSRATGEDESFTVVSGTSITPTPVAGATVHYSVRTAVDGSAWSPEAAISFPEPSPVPTPTSPPPTEGSPKSPSQPSASFQPGVNAGRVYPGQLDLAAATQLGAKLVRVEFPIEASAAQLEKTIAGYAEIGVRVAPLAAFEGKLPSPAEAQSLSDWVKAYGPGGTFWAGRSDGWLAIQSIEFGNETSAGYQYGDNAGDASYTARAETYATRLKEAAEAISATGIKVGLLATTGDWTGDWMNGMFSAVPNLAGYLAGWVSHPYGTSWRKTLEELVNQTAAHGAPSTMPIDITEWGLANDNGRCLTLNYGWNPCMTSQEAGETLRKTLAEIHTMLGSRLGMFMLYQIRDQQPAGLTNEREDYFGLLQHEGQTKGSYTQAAQEVLAG